MCINYTYTYKSCTIMKKEIYDEIKTSERETVKVMWRFRVSDVIIYIAKLARVYARIYCCAACFNEILATLSK